MVTSSSNGTNSTTLRKKCRPAMNKTSPYKSKSSRVRKPSKLGAAAAAAAKSCEAGKTAVEAQTRRKTPTKEMRFEARAKAKAWAKANRNRRSQSTGTPERKVEAEVIVLDGSDDDDDDDDDGNRRNAKKPARDDDTDSVFFDALEQAPLEPEEVKVPTEPRKEVEVEDASDDEFAETDELRNQCPGDGESWMEPTRGLDPAGASFSTFRAKMDP